MSQRPACAPSLLRRTHGHGPRASAAVRATGTPWPDCRIWGARLVRLGLGIVGGFVFWLLLEGAAHAGPGTAATPDVPAVADPAVSAAVAERPKPPSPDATSQRTPSEAPPPSGHLHETAPDAEAMIDPATARSEPLQVMPLRAELVVRYEQMLVGGAPGAETAAMRTHSRHLASGSRRTAIAKGHVTSTGRGELPVPEPCPWSSPVVVAPAAPTSSHDHAKAATIGAAALSTPSEGVHGGRFIDVLRFDPTKPAVAPD